MNIYHTWQTSETSPKVWKLVHLVSKVLIISSRVIVKSDVLDLEVEGPGVAIHEGDGHANHPGLQGNQGLSVLDSAAGAKEKFAPWDFHVPDDWERVVRCYQKNELTASRVLLACTMDNATGHSTKYQNLFSPIIIIKYENVPQCNFLHTFRLIMYFLPSPLMFMVRWVYSTQWSISFSWCRFTLVYSLHREPLCTAL